MLERSDVQLEALAVGYRPQSAKPRYIGRMAVLVASVACLIMAAIIVIDTVTTVARVHSTLPYQDEWDSLALFKDLVTGQVPWTDMFSQHNEHRIFVPRLILFSDYLFFGGRGWFDIVCIAAIQAADTAMVLWLLRRARPKAVGSLAVAATVIMLMSSLRQEENFTWGFQVSFVSVFAFATVATIMFSDALALQRLGRASTTRFVAAWLAAAASTYSMANGLLVGAVLVCIAIAARAPLRIVVATGAVTTVLAILYLNGYEPNSDHPSVGSAVQHPVALLSYLAIYLGNFLDPNVQSARLLGLWGMFAMAVAAWRVFIRGDRHTERCALFGITLFTAASALLTALGRVGFGVDQAFSSRYSTGSGLFWSAMAIYWWTLADGGALKLLLRGVVTATGIVLLYGAIVAQGTMKPGIEQRGYVQDQAQNALLLDLRESHTLESIDSNVPSILAGAAFLKARDLSIFGGRDAKVVTNEIAAAGQVEEGACNGSIETAPMMVDLGRPAERVSGHIWVQHGFRATSRIYLVDRSGIVTGLATANPSTADDPSLWNGFATNPAGTSLRAFLQLWPAGLCELGDTIVSP